MKRCSITRGRLSCMWAQTFVLTSSAFVRACSVCSHGNQPDRCTQSLFHVGHVYTETRLVIPCASQCASPLPVRPKSPRGFIECLGTSLLRGAHRARHGVQRRCIQQTRSTEHRRLVVSHLEEGPDFCQKRRNVVNTFKRHQAAADGGRARFLGVPSG